MSALTLTEKRALVARRLEEHLYLARNGKWSWRDTCFPVTEREWLAVLHEAEKTLTEDQQYRLARELKGVLSPSGTAGMRWEYYDFRLLHATADQRLDAFCRTVGTEAQA